MDFWSALIALYIAISIFAISRTYREQKKSATVTPIFALIGYLLCIVWPLVVAAVLVLSKLFPEPDQQPSEQS